MAVAINIPYAGISPTILPSTGLHASLLEHSNKGKWTALWVCIDTRGSMKIYQNPKAEEWIGRLDLDSNTDVEGKTSKSWFVFKLTTSHKNGNGEEYIRKNKFRTKNKNDRDMWLACIEAVSKGKFKSSAALTPEQKIKLHNYVDQRREVVDETDEGGDLASGASNLMARRSTLPNTSEPETSRNRYQHRRHSIDSPPELPPPRTSHLGPIATDIMSYSSRSSSENSSGNYACGFSDMTSNSAGSDSAFGSDSGVFMNHMFYRDRADNVQVPTWFFLSCSREMAETILMKSYGLGYGSILIRESIKNRQHGSYTASILKELKGAPRVQHFEIQRVVRGYRLGTMKDQPEMLCLYDVVSFLEQRLGQDFFPMTSNTLSDYGIEAPRYETQLPSDDRYHRTEIQGDEQQIYDLPAPDGKVTTNNILPRNDDLPVPTSPQELLQEFEDAEQQIYVNDDIIKQTAKVITSRRNEPKQTRAPSLQASSKSSKPKPVTSHHRIRPDRSNPVVTATSDLESILKARRKNMEPDD